MKVLLVDDHAMFRAGLRMLMTTICPGATALEAATIAEALQLLASHPDTQLCLLDLSFKSEGGLTGLGRIKEMAPETAIVVISGAEDNATIHACLDAGAMSFTGAMTAPRMRERRGVGCPSPRGLAGAR